MSKESKGISNCYVFKSRLQEYAQKVGFLTPVYETIKEGPSHEPFFRSTVIVDNVRYDSLPGFSNRKAAEQSAAEIALMELAKCGEKKECVSQPVHETGLCKNLLQEYAQKMNYAMPTYECRREDTAGRTHHFSCTVEIGGIRYIGAVARTKKEAEIKAARTALLAIQSSSSEMGEKPNEETHYTVVPCKRKEPETVTSKQDAVKTRKPKKGCFKKRPLKKRHYVGEGNQIQSGNVGAMITNLGNQVTAIPSGNGLSNVLISQYQPMFMDAMRTQDGTPNMNQRHEGTVTSENLVIPNIQISDCQPISVSAARTIQDRVSNMNQSIRDTSALQGGFTPFGNGFTNSQISECQRVSVGATGTGHGDALNMNQRHGNASALEVSMVSFGTNCNSIQKSDTVDIPAIGCIVQPSGLDQSNVSNSKQNNEGSVCPIEVDKNTCIEHVGSVMNAYGTSTGNQPVKALNEPAAEVSNMGDSTLDRNEA